MPTQVRRRTQGYAQNQPYGAIQQEPLIMNRAPTTADSAELGTIWVDTAANDFYILCDQASGANVWTSTTGGATTLTSLVVNPGNLTVTAGDVDITVGNLTMDAASTATVGTLSAGNTTVGGTLGVTGATTMTDLAVTGNVTITGDFDITDTASISLTSTNNAAGAITLLANGGAAETIVIQSAQGTGVASLNLSSVAGGITATAALATADAINLVATAGGIDMDAALQINIASSRNTADAIVLSASAGGIDILAAGAATEDIDIVNTAGSVNVTGGEAASDAVVITASNAAGGISVASGTGGIAVAATNGAIAVTSGTGAIDVGADAAAHTITIGNNTGATAVRLNGGTAGAGAINIGQTANDVPITIGNVTGATSVTVNSGTGGIALASTGAGDITANSSDTLLLDAAGVLEINSSAGVIGIGNDAVAQNINIGTGAAARVVTIGNVTGASQVVLNSGTAGVAINTTGTGDVVITSADSTTLDSVGGIEINSSAGSILLGNDAIAQAIGIGTGAAARTITLGNVTGATAVNVNSGTGGINLSSAGIFTLDAVADTQASPTAASTINANVGAATFTGFTTAAAGTQDFTITNSLVSTSSQILCTVANEGANDCQLQIRRITRAAGSFVVKVVNAGAAALNGNLTITFMILN